MLYNLIMACSSARDFQPSLNNFVAALTCSVCHTESSKQKYVLIIISLVINRYIQTRENYYKSLNQYQTEDVRRYTEKRKTSDGIAVDANRGWLSRAHKTGEFFPSREQVLLSIIIGSSAKIGILGLVKKLLEVEISYTRYLHCTTSMQSPEGDVCISYA